MAKTNHQDPGSGASGESLSAQVIQLLDTPEPKTVSNVLMLLDKCIAEATGHELLAFSRMRRELMKQSEAKLLASIAQPKTFFDKAKSAFGFLNREDATTEIVCRLADRHLLMSVATRGKPLLEGGHVALQSRAAPSTKRKPREKASPQSKSASDVAATSDVAAAARYRLGITDLFVEKAQFHLEQRADGYKYLGYFMYTLAVLTFAGGALLAVIRLIDNNDTANIKTWLDFMSRFALSFTCYGFIVLTAVSLTRGARACLDQRERLLAKRHSLRQGRLFLHLMGGHVTIDEMERAFNWNHTQLNAFTHMLSDTKAPLATVGEELVKITPELVKTGVTAARGNEKASSND